MLEQNTIQREFPTLGHRIINAYLTTYPRFVPVDSAEANLESQKQMHEFLYDTISKIYQNPEIINIKSEPDDYYENSAMSNSRPELIEKMSNIEYKFFDFYALLFRIGQAVTCEEWEWFISKETLKLTAKTLKKLEQFGLICMDEKDRVVLSHKQYSLLFPAWRLHTDILQKGLIKRQILARFLQGKFQQKTYHCIDMFPESLVNGSSLSELESYFEKKGYQCENDNLSVTWSKVYPNKKKSYMVVSYSWRNRVPLSFKFQIFNFRDILARFETLDDSLKEIIFHSLKTCDGCGYCTQTDKTGKRATLAENIVFGTESALKCPLYPDLQWYELNWTIVGQMIGLFELSEKIYGK